MRFRSRHAAKTAALHNKNQVQFITCGVAADLLSSAADPKEYHKKYKHLYRILCRATHNKTKVILAAVGFDGFTTNPEVWPDLRAQFSTLDLTVQIMSRCGYSDDKVY